MDAIFNTKTNDCESGEPKAKRSKLIIEEDEPIDLLGFPGSMDLLFLIVEKMTLIEYITFIMTNKRMFNICVNSASIKKDFPIDVFNVEIVEGKITFEISGFEQLHPLQLLETMKQLRIKVRVKELRIKSVFTNKRLRELSDLLSSYNINAIRSFNPMKHQKCWDELPYFLKKFSIGEVQMMYRENKDGYERSRYLEIPENTLKEFFFGSENIDLYRFKCFGVIDEDLILNTKIIDLTIVNHFIPATLLKAVMKQFLTGCLWKAWFFESVESMPHLSQLVAPKELLDFNFDGALPDLRPLFVQGTPPTSPWSDETIFVYREDGRVMVMKRNAYWCCFAPLSQFEDIVIPKVIAQLL